jgi:hypothetical protein
VAADMVHEAAGQALVAKAIGLHVFSISIVAAPTEPSRVVAAAGTIAGVVCGVIVLALVERKLRFGAAAYCLWLFGVTALMNIG